MAGLGRLFSGAFMTTLLAVLIAGLIDRLVIQKFLKI